MAYKLVGFKNLDKRTIAYGLYLMSNLDQRIVVQPSQDYFLAQVENLKITSEEIETFPHCQNSCHPHLNNPNGGKGDNHGTIQCRAQTSHTKQTFIT